MVVLPLVDTPQVDIFDGYIWISIVLMVKLDPTSFTEIKNGVCIPKEYT